MFIREEKELEEIIKQAIICRLAMSVDNLPYVVPLNFGYKDGCLYFHSRKKNSKKIEMIKKNNNVCFEMDGGSELIKDKDPCNWGMKSKSIIGYGKAYIEDDFEKKKDALGIIMEHYSGIKYSDFNLEKVNKIYIIKVVIDNMTGKLPIDVTD